MRPGGCGARFELQLPASLGHSARESDVRPMAGGGLGWKLAPQVSATVEYAYYGSRRSDGDRFTQQKAELGLAFKF